MSTFTYNGIWKGTNEIGETLELIHCVELNRYIFKLRGNVVVTFKQQEIGKLLHHLTDYIITTQREQFGIKRVEGNGDKDAGH